MEGRTEGPTGGGMDGGMEGWRDGGRDRQTSAQVHAVGSKVEHPLAWAISSSVKSPPCTLRSRMYAHDAGARAHTHVHVFSSSLHAPAHRRVCSQPGGKSTPTRPTPSATAATCDSRGVARVLRGSRHAPARTPTARLRGTALLRCPPPSRRDSPRGSTSRRGMLVSCTGSLAASSTASIS